MATRPVYIPGKAYGTLVTRVDVDFHWFAGMAASQKQKSIRSLHEAAARRHINRLLEISSKAELPLGVKLSAFNLGLFTPNGVTTTVECAFQAGKVFRAGGPYLDLIGKSAREARTDPRLKSSGELTGFEFDGERWPTEPRTAFYDWIYLTALRQSPELAAQLLRFDGFTDIEFNPKRSLNSQAAAAALFVALSRRGIVADACNSKDAFLSVLTRERIDAV